ncbi:hypothetical protein M409DRAFT_17362 [Zasmidium cellare ATCC 36951]|uniref:Apple domain-containing protein n=1 Tax=Zasmidium cellare ATCC 36951 TaxID=1080233 RepID=A0A6A6D1S2_ZASCE|nr:uncharacterized protein M409DRAFT_17362 [Zasmidium cellare ATCC 36951]KAF2172122.1 hypothetical protein M409DRAFT_17362 [Zasmidium cellare ATCC 36951]
MARESDAPEVVPGASDLIPVPNEADGLHAVSQEDYPRPDEYSRAPSYSAGHFDPPSEKKGALAEEDTHMLAAASKPGSRKRRRLILIIAGLVLLLLAIGLGVGLGVGLSQNSKDTNEQQQSTAPNSTATQTPTSTTSSPVTAGTTGLAQYFCTDSQNTTSPSGTTYTQTCGEQFQVGHPSYYNQNITMENLDHTTVYTFSACLESCDGWNAANNHPACRAVTYYANLTAPVKMWGGNCFLKNDRGQGYRSDPVDYEHTVSAWQGCLNVTCFGTD